MRTPKFKIMEIYQNGNKTLGYKVKLADNTVVKVPKDKIYLYFKQGECVNAVGYVTGKSFVVRGKQEKLKVIQCKANIFKKETLSKTNNKPTKINVNVKPIVFCNVPEVQIRGVEYQKELPLLVNTYRYIYGIMLDNLTMWSKQEDKVRVLNCTGITGVRRIGKTILLKQLYNTLEGSLFISGETYVGDIYSLLIAAKQQGVQYVFIDEMCKMPLDMRNIFISWMKNGFEDMYFIFTGSVPYIIEEISASICDCDLLTMQPIMYIERLSWQNKVSITQAIKYSNITIFEDWLKTNTLNYVSCLLHKSKYYYYNLSQYTIEEGTFGGKNVVVVCNLIEDVFQLKIVIDVSNQSDKDVKFSKYKPMQIEGVQEIVLTCEDTGYKPIEFEDNVFENVYKIRNDIVVCLLEYGYIEKIKTGKDTTETLSALYQKLQML